MPNFSYDSARVYNDTRKVLHDIVKVVGHFPKSYKYTVGQKLSDSAASLLASIASAFREQDPDAKLPKIERALFWHDTVVIMFRVSYDLNLVSRKENMEILVILNSILKQLEGWGQSQAKKRKLGLSEPEVRTETPQTVNA